MPAAAYWAGLRLPTRVIEIRAGKMSDFLNSSTELNNIGKAVPVAHCPRTTAARPGDWVYAAPLAESHTLQSGTTYLYHGPLRWRIGLNPRCGGRWGA